jgi:ADP-heptose:LPS heptosyltransferase
MSRILVIQLARLGDLIQTTPFLKELVESHRGDQIEVLVLEQNQSVIQGMPGLQRIRILPKACNYPRISAEFMTSLAQKAVPDGARALFKSLDLPNYSKVVNLTYDPLACWLTGQARSEKLEGGYLDSKFEWLFRGAAHVYVAAREGFRDLSWFNLVDLWRASSSAAAIPGSDSHPFAAVAEDLPFPIPSGTIVALNPGSSDPERRWPPAGFARLAERLCQAGIVPVLVGAPADRDACLEVEALTGVALKNLAGRTSVPQMARLLAECRLLISVDTGAVHLASAVGTPVVGLYGASASFRETAPWGPEHMILQVPLGVELSRLEPDLVAAAALHKLGLLDADHLRNDLERHGVTAWETFFFPQDADPLGGIGYRPLHKNHLNLQDIFTRTLRHLFAVDLRKSEADISLDYLRALVDSTSASSPRVGQAELDEHMCVVAAAKESFEYMAAAAARLVTLSRTAGHKSANQIQSIVTELVQALDQLRVQGAQPEGTLIKPVVEYFYWDFHTMPMLRPSETFAYHQRRYSKAAAMLKQTEALTRNFLAQ